MGKLAGATLGKAVAVPVAVAVTMLTAACDSNGGGTGVTFSTVTSTTATKQPVPAAALPNLFLTSAQVDSVLGVAGSRTDRLSDTLQEDQTVGAFAKGYKFPEECVYVMGPAIAPVYSNSGSVAVRGERIAVPPPHPKDPSPNANQFVVLFPSANEADAFFAHSAERWPACANRQDNVPGGTPDAVSIEWKVGPVSNVDGVLSTTVFVRLSKNDETKSQTCQRALTVRNNVAIDVAGCRQDPGNVGVQIARQIASNVDKQ
ncbi:sensor domain-containing protein [Mycobacterium sherrisii]|uniref:sensor domain-containing protein n=1 Tax=Mycobacterium sherrisii TaxID=243061 RepID=UPI002DDCDAEA|nr:sensor domain-containing protein [Mycobacterium sherrisii]MEC4763413.1 sensor domain-containing protein [Mycobacterium sherrisii]